MVRSQTSGIKQYGRWTVIPSIVCYDASVRGWLGSRMCFLQELKYKLKTFGSNLHSKIRTIVEQNLRHRLLLSQVVLISSIKLIFSSISLSPIPQIF